MVNKSIVRLDRVTAVYNGPIESVVYNGGELQNGWVVEVGGLSNGNRDLREAVKPSATTKRVALIAHPEIRYEEYTKADAALEKFAVEAGKAARTYHLAPTDIVSISNDGLTLLAANAVKGNLVVLEAGSFKLKEIEVGSLTGTEVFVGEIIDVEKIGTATVVGQPGAIGRVNTLVVIEVRKNG